jgi:hypothetical protein
LARSAASFRALLENSEPSYATRILDPSFITVTGKLNNA